MSSASSSTRRPPGRALWISQAIAKVTTNEYTSVATTATTWSPNSATTSVHEHPVAPAGFDRLVGEEPEEQRPDDAAHEVDADDVECVVEAELELQVHRDVADDTGDRPDRDRRHPTDEAGARGDRDESGDRTGRRAQDRGPAAVEPLDHTHPSMAAAAAMCVFTNACTAMPSARRAEPALKPNHPNQRMPVPISVSGKRVRRHR